jgi:hypothetical protein
MSLDAVRTATVSGGSTAVPFNQYCAPFNVGFGVYSTISGSAEATSVQGRVEHCFDKEVSASTVWFTHIDVSAFTMSANATPVDGNYAYPVTHARLFVTNVSASGSTPGVVFHVLQTGY